MLRLLKCFPGKRRASLKQLQSLAGTLNWTSNVVTCGRSYLRNIINTLGQLQKSNSKARLAKEIFDDTKRWIIIVLGASPCKRVFCNPHVNIVQLDVCSKGVGYTYNEDYGLWIVSVICLICQMCILT